MNIVLWVAQIVLAFAFGASGAMKVMQSPDALRDEDDGRMDWVDDLFPSAAKVIGGLEVLAAIGLILPPALGVVPVLAALAAAGLVVVMVGAMVLHAKRGEYFPSMVINGLLAAVAVFVAVGRFGAHAF